MPVKPSSTIDSLKESFLWNETSFHRVNVCWTSIKGPPTTRTKHWAFLEPKCVKPSGHHDIPLKWKLCEIHSFCRKATNTWWPKYLTCGCNVKEKESKLVLTNQVLNFIVLASFLSFGLPGYLHCVVCKFGLSRQPECQRIRPTEEMSQKDVRYNVAYQSQVEVSDAK